MVYQDFEAVDLTIPYKSGFLAFREVPPFKVLLARAPQPQPQLLLVDGFGVLHPRRCGAASHLGVETGLPTIGVGKKLLSVDGLEEWLVVKDLRSALMQERGEDLRMEQLNISDAGSSPACCWGPADARDVVPMTSSVLVPAMSRGGSSNAVSGAVANRFNWQNVSEGGVPVASAFASGELMASTTISGAIADSGPVFEPNLAGVGPMGRAVSGVGPELTTGKRAQDPADVLPAFSARRPSVGGDAFAPTVEGSDTDDTGTFVKRADGGSTASAAAYYTRPDREGVSVVCTDLMSSVDVQRLGIAVAGIAGTVKPVYVSVGVPLCCSATLLPLFVAAKTRYLNRFDLPRECPVVTVRALPVTTNCCCRAQSVPRNGAGCGTSMLQAPDTRAYPAGRPALEAAHPHGPSSCHGRCRGGGRPAGCFTSGLTCAFLVCPPTRQPPYCRAPK